MKIDGMWYISKRTDYTINNGKLYVSSHDELLTALQKLVIDKQPDDSFVILPKNGSIIVDTHDVILCHPFELLERNGFTEVERIPLGGIRRYDNRTEVRFIAKFKKGNITVTFTINSIDFGTYSFDKVEQVTVRRE